ncbi:helicase domino-like [Saccostrea echinata]|uniref:helicase domino-like n=1 Tax=Saccostrea echinata TaxID=191078 RepID=UPI002A80D36E|nr:helicase domino-like [Saccostrea echinata]
MSNQTPKSTSSLVGASSSASVSTSRAPMDSKPPALNLTFPNLTALGNQTGPSPKKKIKLEEKPAATHEIANHRKLILDLKYKSMLDIKEPYIDNLTEMFFLQNGGNLMDFLAWKKRPTPQLVHFLKSGSLDSDDEEESSLERKINNEVKVITCSGSNVPLATPVAISTTLPPSVAALNQQAGFDPRRPGGRHGMIFGHVQHLSQPPTILPILQAGPIILPGTGAVTTDSLAAKSTTQSVPAQKIVTTTSMTTVTLATPLSMPQLHSHLAKAITDSKPPAAQTSSTKSNVTAASPIVSVSTPVVKTTKSPPISPNVQQPKTPTISGVYDGAPGVGTQEAIVERAKQEAQVMQRVSELRKEGLWSTRRLPKVQEPPRNKGHWDYLLEEMQWLAADFAQERKWKKAAARKVAKMVSKYFQDLEQKEIRAEKEEGLKLKKIASQMAKQIREFWTNIEKVVQYKAQARLEEKRKKALDLHLNFIVDQTEKYSTWLTEGLKKEGTSIGSGSNVATPAHSDAGDEEFRPAKEDESDDEETIEKEEAEQDPLNTKAELDALQKESELPFEELLKTLPKEVLENPVPVHSDEADEEDKKDTEFKATEDEKDEEDTIAEQEKHEKKIDYSKELSDLKDENEMTMEELYQKYAGAYDSDFEMPEEEEDSEDEDSDDDEEEEDESEEEEEEEEDEESMEEESTEKDDVGLEFLTQKDEDSKSQGDFDQEGPGKEITDIAAQAQSLQPKGYTLETTTVKTAVPFLLKHTLREYQHVGLNWLATMYEQRLNGILADEMGLGKTIQTIALLAHLACEKGIWGPHLIVVPTSVMLNWEMEIKKWCPAFKILTYYGSLKERKLKRQGWTKTNAFHICITSYKLVIQDHQSFRRKKWKYFILDEAQNIKNFKSQRWQTLLNFSSQRRLLLTGTPLQNSLMELWSLMHFLMPHVFQSHREFKEWFANPLTGMIEGSHEYNESLIKRLHKVLRPFLLRRLKKDVEKQMPKKYEHVVMCHLSKRQRYLYDDFMSQTKTKETLASGHFMSVINILMQLRKVCNHPSLFDPRPIVSPFKTEGIDYFVPSLVLNCLNYDPFKDIDLHSLYPSLADMELNLPAFVAHRVKKLQTPRVLIEEIDSQEEPPSRPPTGKLKPVIFKGIAPVQPTGRASPTTSEKSTPASPAVQSAMKTETVNGIQVENAHTPVTNATATVQPPVKVLGQSAGQTGVQQPLTVHIQQTDQGARLMIPAGQLSQLPAGFIQIVQTSTGQQIIATSTPMSTSSQILASIPTSSVQALSVATTSSTVVNGPPTITTVASSTSSTLVTSVNAQVKTTPAVQLPSSTTIVTGARPVMRVSPLSSIAPVTSTQDPSVSKPSTAQVTTTMSHSSTKMSVLDCENLHNKSSRFYMESLTSKLQDLRKQKLEYIAKVNKRRCECKPVYGQDLCDAVDVFKDMNKTSVKDNTWKGLGMAYCRNVKCWRNPNHPDIYWKQTTVLSELVHSPMDYLCELKDILSRFVFVTPSIVSPQIQLHASHPSPSYLNQQRRTEFCLRQHISPQTECLHQISSRMSVQFPELRLIQYDCGKLQTMDILLRQLKSENHRVLIFTQMTKMLNILEAFLNFHGHRYLRLDGTTKVDQRQFLMDRFNADKRIFAFILSTRSGGIGVNLTGADTVIFYDSDWNPTMDAQAQDRCHRIGQTRDVHIYRLISERTVEENILKKANQKRMLGDMAIEGGNFTTAFFKEQTIQELFTEPSGLQSLADEITENEKVKETVTEMKEETKAGGDAKEENMVQSEKNVMAQFEKVLAKAEDETDAQAVDLVKAEQKAELAEFDENIPWDEREAELKKEEELSKVEQEIAMLDKELTPVERYAVNFMELEMDPMEELEMGEEDIENVKKDWELGRLKALKEEEERRAELEEDEMLYIYYRDDTYNQVKKKSKKAQKANKTPAKIVTPSRITPARNKAKQFNDDEYIPSSGRAIKVTPKVTATKNTISPRLNVGRNRRANKVLAKAEAVVVDEEGDGAINVTFKCKPKSAKANKKVLIDNNVTIPNDESEPAVDTTPKLVLQQKKGRGRPSILKQGKGKTPDKVAAIPQVPVIISTASPQKTVQLSQVQVQQVQAQIAKAQQNSASQPTIAQLMYQAHQQQPSIQFARQSAPTLPHQLNNTSQLLSSSQLQHLKQIISKAAHTNLAKIAPPKANPAGVVQVGQQNLVQQLNVKSAQNQPAIQLVGQTSVIPQPQTVAVSPQVAQIVSQGPGQTIQYITQPTQVATPRPVQAIQQVVSRNSAGQPTLQFIKVNASNAQQPVLQYVNTSAGTAGQVRIQNTAPQNQQGVVFLQLGGGKAIPVSLSQGSPLSVPMARLVTSRNVANGNQKVAHVVQQNAIPQQYIARNIQPTRISAPISRFQTAAAASQSNPAPPVSSPQPSNLPTVVQQARYRIPKISQQQPKENPVPSTPPTSSPFWNPNLVIRTRKAAAQPGVSREEVEQGETSDNLPFVIGKPNPPTPQTSTNGGSPNQFISLLRAGVASGQVSNVVIKQNAIISSQGMVVTSQANSETQVTTNGPLANQVNDVSVFLSDVDQEKMPLWAPPTPPHDDNDIYLDQSLLFLYEPNVMPETQLPPVYIKKEHKKPKIESITTRQKKQRKEEQTRVPRSLFDRPSAQLLKIRREHKQKSGLLKPFRPVPPPIVKPNVDTSDHPEWLIHEDWALLQAVQSLFDVPLNLLVVSPAHHPNWDLVADVVNTCSRVYRSAKQCKNRYENVIIPREEGRILYDINPRKQSKKTKGIYKTKNNRPMRTSQLYIQDNNQAVTMLYSFRFESAKQIAGKRPPPLKQTLVNPTLKNPKHATVLSENNINYDQPLNPMSVAEIRAQRIQREKKQNQAAAQATADQQLAAQRSVVQTATTTGTTVVQQTTTSVAVAPVAQPIQTAVVSSAVLQTGVVQKAAAVGQVAVTRTATGNIVVNTQGGVPTNFAAINRRMSQQATVASIAQPATVTVAGAITPANIRAQRTAAPLTIQEITAIASQPQTQVTTSIATGPQVARTQLQTTVTGAQLATVQRTNTGQQLTQQTVTKNLTPQQLLQLQQRQQNLINQQKMQQQQVQQQQQLRMQKLNLTQQQLKQLQQQGRAQKTVIAQQLVTGVGQLTAAQLIPQAQVQHITQSATVAGTSGTLVKTVSAPGIPVSTVNINVSVPQQKGVVGKSATVSQIPQAKIQHIQQIQQQMRHQLKQPQKITSVGQQVAKGQSFPLNAVQIIQQPASGATGRHLTYSLQQFMQQNKGSGMIITSQPIITTVTQSQQPTGQMVTKVLPTSAVPTTHLQTLSATPISVTHVSAVQASNVTAQPVATSISLTGVGGQAGKPLTVTTVAQDASTGTTIQVQPATAATQQGSQTTTQQLIPQTQVVQQVPVASHTPQKILTQTAHQIQVTPGSIQQVQAGNVAQAVSATPTAVTLTITPAAQSVPSTGTLIQQPVVVTQAVQATSQPSTVTSQAALAAAAALPSTTVTIASAVQSSTQSQQTTPGSAKPAAPYAMRTRNHPKT